ncbi:DUF881 domain-containing protein [Streptomyces sp. CNQ085]|uniref:DUF881 domain-containing protein n=1 Tax=Streptomyces sp. CNQ085 TaxID=2886944 RepID=UPI001F504937|nr:DUF881 domain-containing protein [Streptomyces sp. CNQ085]MCI0383537.1 DUF881 domain-containing protein [Streptomyces sp. CNQ085]
MTNSRFRPVRLATAGVFALAGFLFWISFNTAQGIDLRTDDSMLRLSDLIEDRSDDIGALHESVGSLRREVDALARRDSGGTEAEKRAFEELERAAGMEKLSGSGLTVTLDDAPPDATARTPGLPDPQPNDLVVHQQDLQAVVNALWAGGAEGMKVMDQRLVSTSAVRCVGNTLILQGRLYSPPYTVTAVGDPDRMREALEDAPAVRGYREYVDAYGLGWSVDEHDAVTLPGYSGTVDLTRSAPVDEAADG